MKHALVVQPFMAAALAFGMGLVHAAPNILSDAQLDHISAGTQFSLVEGGGSALLGTVSVRADTMASNTGGSAMTKATLKLNAAGTELDGFGYGISGAGETVSGVYGDVSLDQGTLRIHVKTMSKLQQNGGGFTKSMIQVKTSGSPMNVTRTSAKF